MMGFKKARFFAAGLPLLIVLFGAGTSVPSFYPQAAAQSQPPQKLIMPKNEEQLDALLATHNWNALGAALSAPSDSDSLIRSMNWLHARISTGGGSLLSFSYAMDLWAAANGVKNDDEGTDLRMTAAMITLYAYELLQIDGAKCADISAPRHRIEQLVSARHETLVYLAGRPAELRKHVVDIAIALEKKTAPLRGDDDLICRDGMEQMKAGLERGTQHEVPTPNGHVGRTVAVQPPQDWSPSFLSPEVYRPLQDTARAGMKATLLKIIGL